MSIGWSLSELGRFLFVEMIWAFLLFLLCLFFGQLTAMARLSRAPVLTQLLNAEFALFRRVPLLPMLALAAVWTNGALDVATMTVVLFLRFVPELSDAQMEGMRRVPENGNPEGTGAWMLFKQSLAFPDRMSVLGGIWRSLFLCGWLFSVPRHPFMNAVAGVPFLLVTVTVGFWFVGLLTEAVLRFLCGRLQRKA